MDGIKKTALFLSGLEWKTVDLLLRRLDPEQARAVRREMMSLENVSVRETGRLAGEFLVAAGAGRSRIGVVEHQLAAPATYAPPQRQVSPPRFSDADWQAGENAGKRGKPFDFFRNVDSEDIVREISSEHPQTVAVVLAHLPASLAGEVLGGLPVSLQVEVARRLSEFEAMDEQILRDIEATLHDRFERRRRDERRRARGNAAVQHILKSTDPRTQTRVLSQLDAQSERRIAFDDLERLDNAELSRLFRSVDSVTAMLALVGAKPSLIERITRQFTPTEEYEIRRQLKQTGQITEEDVQRARNAVMGKLKIEN